MSYMAGDKVIVVKQRNTLRCVDADSVIFIESMGRKAVLHLFNETIEYYAVIHRLEEQLRPNFFRIHRAYLINLRYVEDYNKREVQMTDGNSLLISKYRLAEFQEIMACHNQ